MVLPTEGQKAEPGISRGTVSDGGRAMLDSTHESQVLRTLGVPVDGGLAPPASRAPLPGCARLWRHGSDASPELVWLRAGAHPGPLVRGAFLLGSIPIFGQVWPDAEATRALAARGEGWKADEPDRRPRRRPRRLRLARGRRQHPPAVRPGRARPRAALGGLSRERGLAAGRPRRGRGSLPLLPPAPDHAACAPDRSTPGARARPRGRDVSPLAGRDGPARPARVPARTRRRDRRRPGSLARGVAARS